MLAFQPALLACLASNPLPVSNLTNLIVAERFGLGVADFARDLLLPTIAACVVGWLCFRRVFATESPSHIADREAEQRDIVDRAALRRGLPIVGFVLLGFTVGSALGVAEWIVAAIAVAWAALLATHLPWRAIPYEGMLVAAANIGPVLVISGALSGLLWRDTARRMGIKVSARRYSEIGVKVGLPALVIASAVLLVTHG